VAQDHDHLIGKPDALLENSNKIAWTHGGRGAEEYAKHAARAWTKQEI
jgi:hypothetical protein